MRCHVVILWLMVLHLGSLCGSEFQEDDLIENYSYNVLYAPWRHETSCPINPYIKSEWKKSCPFCRHFAAQEDAQNYILKRMNYHVIMLNLHPYSPGHLLLVPYDHVDSLVKLSREARIEIMESLSQSLVLLKNVVHNHGANVGVNIGGKGAGGSIPDHVHFHIVPRWEGDNSFMAAIADTRVLSCDMNGIYNRLREAFENFTL